MLIAQEWGLGLVLPLGSWTFSTQVRYPQTSNTTYGFAVSHCTELSRRTVIIQSGTGSGRLFAH